MPWNTEKYFPAIVHPTPVDMTDTPQSRQWHPPDTSLDMSPVAMTSHVNANACVYRQCSWNQLEQSSHFGAMAGMEFPRRNSPCVCMAIASVLIIHDTQTAVETAGGLTNWYNQALCVCSETSGYIARSSANQRIKATSGCFKIFAILFPSCWRNKIH